MPRLHALLAVARRLDAVFLLLLVGAYMLAALVPAPPALVMPLPGVRTAQVVLAGLLFVAGLRMAIPDDVGEVVRRGRLIWIGVVGRLLPVVGALACLSLLAAGGASPQMIDLAVGLTMVIAMPTANTSTAWTRRSSGDLAVCVGVVVATTMLSPLVIPAALEVVDRSIGQRATTGFTFHDVALSVIGWVVVPIVLGVVTGRTSGLVAGKRLTPLGSLSTLAALLLLNYINASQSLPGVLERGGSASLASAACGAAAVVPLLYGAGLAAARLGRAPTAQAVALCYAVGMSNTGLASTLAAVAFPGRPATLYPIVVCTLLQHVVAAIVHDRSQSATMRVIRSAAEPEPQERSLAAPPSGPR